MPTYTAWPQGRADDGARRGRGRLAAARARTALVATAAVVLAIELFSRTPLYDRVLYGIVVALPLLAVVVYSAFRGGVKAGLLSAGIAVLYNAYFVAAAVGLAGLGARELRIIALIGVVLPVLALLIGRQRERIDRLLAGERTLRREAETARAEAESALAEAEQARDEARQAASRSAFLSEASSVLASSLDYQETLRGVGRLAVPRLGDWCIIDVLEGNGGLHRVAVAHTDPAKNRLAEELVRFPPDPRSDMPIAVALRTGEPALIEDVSAAWLDGAAVRQPEYRELLRRMGLRSVMLVPLIARGRALGVISLSTAESGRRYDRDDLALARELARTAAIAVDNARLYQQAIVANQAKTDFLSVMSHELRTPLNAILGYADLLEAGIPDRLTDAQAEQVGRVTASARHLLHLIEEILAFSRMEAGEDDVSSQAVDLSELVREVARMIAPLAEESGLRFRLRVPEDPTEVVTDPGKIRQILLNLLSNAVKFTHQGEIELSAAVEDGRIVLRVSDTGIGIPPAYQEKIFDPFYQVEGSLIREKGGTGLGLAVARRLAVIMGGDVSITSAPGKGTTFTVEIPAGPEARSHAA
jgi:signal transduction histidine kinase